MIKVKLLAGTHGVYQELINYPPKNVKYIYPKLETFHYGKIRMIKRNIISLIFNLFQLPRLLYLPKNQTHLIHSCRGVLVLNKKPWIIDFEHIVSTVGYNFNRINNPHYKRIIEKFLSSKYCKKILPWSYAAKQTIFHYLNAAKFKNKIEVIYPAMHKISKLRKEKSDKIRILFVGHAFLAKGGLDLVEAFKILNKKYDVKLTMITNLPKEYNKLKSLPNLNFISPLPREKIFEFYRQADIFCLPSYVDSFGFVLLEAKAFGLPIVTSNFFAMPEIIRDGETGLLIKIPEKIRKFPFTKNPKKDLPTYINYVNKGKHKELIDQLINKLSCLIEDNKLRKKFAKEGKKEIERGKFSIEQRNKKLKKIYEEILIR